MTSAVSPAVSVLPSMAFDVKVMSDALAVLQRFQRARRNPVAQRVQLAFLGEDGRRHAASRNGSSHTSEITCPFDRICTL